MRKTHLPFVLMLSIFASSCAVHPVKEDAALPAFVPDSFSTSGQNPRQDQWWESFNNEELSRLVEEALRNNLDLKTAWARLGQFAAVVKLSGAGLYPQVNLNSDMSRTESDQGRLSINSDRFAINVAASYELDLWKRIESQQRAAIFDYESSRENIEATALTLSALITERWLFIIEQKAQLALLHEQLKSSQTFLELNELRFSQGRTNAVSVFQQRAQTASIQTQFPAIESNIEVFNNQLALLLGQTPEYALDVTPEALPALPALPQTGIPSEILMQRPDIRSAHNQIVAADYRVASAIADRYPTLRITGQGGLQTGQIENLFEDTLWNIAAGILYPIMDGRRRQAEIERNRAIWQERLYGYEQKVLTALHEIENALIQEHKQQERVNALEHQLELSRKTLEESQSRFLNGLSEYLPVLTALIDVQQQERQLLSSKRDLLLFRVDLHQSLGGTWMSRLEQPMDMIMTSIEKDTN